LGKKKDLLTKSYNVTISIRYQTIYQEIYYFKILFKNKIVLIDALL